MNKNWKIYESSEHLPKGEGPPGENSTWFVAKSSKSSVIIVANDDKSATVRNYKKLEDTYIYREDRFGGISKHHHDTGVGNKSLLPKKYIRMDEIFRHKNKSKNSIFAGRRPKPIQLTVQVFNKEGKEEGPQGKAASSLIEAYFDTDDARDQDAFGKYNEPHSATLENHKYGGGSHPPLNLVIIPLYGKTGEVTVKITARAYINENPRLSSTRGFLAAKEEELEKGSVSVTFKVIIKPRYTALEGKTIGIFKIVNYNKFDAYLQARISNACARWNKVITATPDNIKLELAIRELEIRPEKGTLGYATVGTFYLTSEIRQGTEVIGKPGDAFLNPRTGLSVGQSSHPDFWGRATREENLLQRSNLGDYVPIQAPITLDIKRLNRERVMPNGLARTRALEQTDALIAHEIGHTLGIGAAWWTDNKVGIQNPKENVYDLSIGVNWFYNGTKGNLEYGNLYKTYTGSAAAELKLPLQNNAYFGRGKLPAEVSPDWIGLLPKNISGHYEPGDQTNSPKEGSHPSRKTRTSTNNRWWNDTFCPAMVREIMTPQLHTGVEPKISRVTLGLLEDLGWTVDYSKADAYNPMPEYKKDYSAQQGDRKSHGLSLRFPYKKYGSGPTAHEMDYSMTIPSLRRGHADSPSGDGFDQETPASIKGNLEIHALSVWFRPNEKIETGDPEQVLIQINTVTGHAYHTWGVTDGTKSGSVQNSSNDFLGIKLGGDSAAGGYLIQVCGDLDGSYTGLDPYGQAIKAFPENPYFQGRSISGGEWHHLFINHTTGSGDLTKAANRGNYEIWLDGENLSDLDKTNLYNVTLPPDVVQVPFQSSSKMSVGGPYSLNFLAPTADPALTRENWTRQGGLQYNGGLAELCMWDSSLSATEIKNLYECLNPAHSNAYVRKVPIIDVRVNAGYSHAKNLIGYWPMGEGEESGANQNFPSGIKNMMLRNRDWDGITITDFSKNHNDGKLDHAHIIDGKWDPAKIGEKNWIFRSGLIRGQRCSNPNNLNVLWW